MLRILKTRYRWHRTWLGVALFSETAAMGTIPYVRKMLRTQRPIEDEVRGAQDKQINI